jgi:hypothetical protein
MKHLGAYLIQTIAGQFLVQTGFVNHLIVLNLVPVHKPCEFKAIVVLLYIFRTSAQMHSLVDPAKHILQQQQPPSLLVPSKLG